MHIRIIHQYFRLPEEGGSLRTWHIGKYLAEEGFRVSVITAGNINKYRIRQVDGMEIHYLPVYYSNHLKFLSRIHAFWLFVWKAIRLLRHLPPADLHYILTTPLTTGIIGISLKRLRKIPYVFEVGDLWPDAPAQLGVLNNSLLLAMARKLERSSYRNALGLTGLSKDISDYLIKKEPLKPVYTLPNLSDTDYFHPSRKDPSLVNKYDVENSFVISYIGTLGLANHLEYLITASRALPENFPVRILIMGDGARYQHLKNLVTPKDRITFLPPAARSIVKEVINISDALYVSFMDIPVLKTGSPNKLFDGLASGKLIIVNFKGWVKELLESAECGLYHDPHVPKDLGEKLEPYIRSTGLLKEAQENARHLATSRFSKEKLLPGFADWLRYLIQEGSAP